MYHSDRGLLVSDAMYCCNSISTFWRTLLQGPPKDWYSTTALHSLTNQKTSNIYRPENRKSRSKFLFSVKVFEKSQLSFYFCGNSSSK
jgi:hypothetical protein